MPRHYRRTWYTAQLGNGASALALAQRTKAKARLLKAKLIAAREDLAAADKARRKGKPWVGMSHAHARTVTAAWGKTNRALGDRFDRIESNRIESIRFGGSGVT